MASEYVTFEDLVRFHREVIAPDLDARLAPITEKLSSLDTRLSAVDARFAPMTEQLSNLDTRLSTVDARFGSMTEHLSSVDARSMRLLDEVMHLRHRLDTGMNWLYDEIVDSRRDAYTHFDRIYKRLDSISSDFDASKAGLRRVEDRTEDHEKRITRLEKRRP